MTYRVAASVLEQMFPVDAGKSHETLRTHTRFCLTLCCDLE
jgi:hypothetical protein